MSVKSIRVMMAVITVITNFNLNRKPGWLNSKDGH